MIAGSQSVDDGIPQTLKARFESDFVQAAAYRGGYLRRIMVTFMDDIHFQTPIGYEDADEFHYGAKPVFRRAGRILAVQCPAKVPIASCGCEADEFCCLT